MPVYARLHGLFPEDEMVCTHTLYNEVWAGNLDLSVVELPEAMKRSRCKGSKPRENKKSYGKSISERPEIAALRTQEGALFVNVIASMLHGFMQSYATMSARVEASFVLPSM